VAEVAVGFRFCVSAGETAWSTDKLPASGLAEEFAGSTATFRGVRFLTVFLLVTTFLVVDFFFAVFFAVGFFEVAVVFVDFLPGARAGVFFDAVPVDRVAFFLAILKRA